MISPPARSSWSRRLRSFPALVLVFAVTGCATPVTTQTAAPPTNQSTNQPSGEPGDQTTAQLKARCQQLIAYFDRFGAGRSNNSDGRRNHTRISAEIDCSKGLYAEGIAEMEALLRRKKFTPPPPGPDENEDYN